MNERLDTESWTCPKCNHVSEATQGTTIKFCSICTFEMHKTQPSALKLQKGVSGKPFELNIKRITLNYDPEGAERTIQVILTNISQDELQKKNALIRETVSEMIGGEK